MTEYRIDDPDSVPPEGLGWDRQVKNNPYHVEERYDDPILDQLTR